MMTWAYIAGSLDGDGTVSVVARKARSSSFVTVDFAQSSDLDGSCPNVLMGIQAFLADIGIRSSINVSKRNTGRIGVLSDGRKITSRRESWHLWVQSRSGCLAILEGMFPFLVVKRVKAQDVIRLLKLYGSMDMRGKFSFKKHDDLTKEMIEADFASGMTWKQVAAKNNISLAGIRWFLNREQMLKENRDARDRRRIAASVDVHVH